MKNQVKDLFKITMTSFQLKTGQFYKMFEIFLYQDLSPQHTLLVQRKQRDSSQNEMKHGMHLQEFCLSQQSPLVVRTKLWFWLNEVNISTHYLKPP